eukprot:scaffold122_cov387-Prasinococcus_capsulatus_cf.AAC.2
MRWRWPEGRPQAKSRSSWSCWAQLQRREGPLGVVRWSAHIPASRARGALSEQRVHCPNFNSSTTGRALCCSGVRRAEGAAARTSARQRAARLARFVTAWRRRTGRTLRDLDMALSMMAVE